MSMTTPESAGLVAGGVTEAMVNRAMDAYFKGEDWRVDLGCALADSTASMRRALEAAHPGVSREWLPIASAPMDGTEVLIAGGTYSLSCSFSDCAFDEVVVATFQRNGWQGPMADYNHYYDHKPTHWMPLPSAPKDTTHD